MFNQNQNPKLWCFCFFCPNMDQNAKQQKSQKLWGAEKSNVSIAVNRLRQSHHVPNPSTSMTPVTMMDFFLLKSLCLVVITSLFWTLMMRDQIHCGVFLLSGGRTVDLFLRCWTSSLAARVMWRVMTSLQRSCHQGQLAPVPGLCHLPRGKNPCPARVSG